MFKIVAEEQVWLDRFNDYFGVKYKNGQLLEENEVDNVPLGKFTVKYAVSGFNKTIAQGKVIWIEKVEKEWLKMTQNEIH